ncbi:HAD family hydrolase [Marinobacter salexigens]|uniref:HAD family phosphatase n=1 Tax=Marinobacter salexigens TaxID=1925763 RepID=A0ABS6AFB4_9GAMM|nr:HAD family phosphatase [Marinobacter salexigens]MBU2875903.1 HAD family phosphatase [Marinobacter salexigens]
MPIQAVLFDHDGTLVNSEPTHLKLWNAVLRDYGVELSDQEYKDLYAGVPTPTNATDLISRFRIPSTAADLIAAKQLETKRYLEEQSFPLMPGVSETILALDKLGLKLGVVTGASAHGLGVTLRANKFESLFSLTVSGDDVLRSKPAPDCYLLALEHLSLQPEHCIAIEDTEHGLRAAAAAGIRCLAIPTEMSKHHDFSLATAVLPDMNAAFEYVKERSAQA